MKFNEMLEQRLCHKVIEDILKLDKRHNEKHKELILGMNASWAIQFAGKLIISRLISLFTSTLKLSGAWVSRSSVLEWIGFQDSQSRNSRELQN